MNKRTIKQRSEGRHEESKEEHTEGGKKPADLFVHGLGHLLVGSVGVGFNMVLCHFLVRGVGVLYGVVRNYTMVGGVWVCHGVVGKYMLVRGHRLRNYMVRYHRMVRSVFGRNPLAGGHNLGDDMAGSPHYLMSGILMCMVVGMRSMFGVSADHV